MISAQQATITGKSKRRSLETWVALLAFTVAALIRVGAFKHLPW